MKSRENLPTLTLRQKEVMDYLRLGCTNLEISRFLGISINTVKTHVTTVYKLLDAGNRTEAVHRLQELPKGGAGQEATSAVAVPLFSSTGRTSEGSSVIADLTVAVTWRLSRCQRFPVIAHEACPILETGDYADRCRRSGAKHILLGSLSRSDRRILVNVRLLDGEKGRLHWMQDFEVCEVVPDWVEDVSVRIVAVLVPELIRAERQRTDGCSSEELGPWEKTIRGIGLLDIRTNAKCREAMDLFMTSIVEAPEFALAHFGVALASYLAVLEQRGDESMVATIHHHARLCVQLAPGSHDGNYILAISRILEGRIDESLILLQEAVRINPSSIAALNLLGQILAMKGRYCDGARILERSVLLSMHTPSYSRNQGALAMVRFAEADYEGVLGACREGLLYDFDNRILLALYAAASFLQRRDEDMADAMARLGRLEPPFHMGVLAPLLKNITPEPRDRFLASMQEIGFRL